MARPTLFTHRKFLRLARALESEATALGHLEFIWHAANESGNPMLGEADDVEAVAHWRGRRGQLVTALRDAGFIEAVEDHYVIHDYWHHCPDYVRKRAMREEERRARGYSLDRNGLPRATVEAVFARAPHCCAICGNPNDLEIDHITSVTRGGTDDLENLRILCRPCNRRKSLTDRRMPSSDRSVLDARPVDAAAVTRTPAPAPAPAPLSQEEKSTRKRAMRIPDDFELTAERRAFAVDEGLDPDRTFAIFVDFWHAKAGANACKLDWDRTWKNWCRDKHDRGNHSGPPARDRQPRPSAIQRVYRATEPYVDGRGGGARGVGVAVDDAVVRASVPERVRREPVRDGEGAGRAAVAGGDREADQRAMQLGLPPAGGRGS